MFHCVVFCMLPVIILDPVFFSTVTLKSMGLDARKPVIGVFNQVRLKPAPSDIENS